MKIISLFFIEKWSCNRLLLTDPAPSPPHNAEQDTRSTSVIEISSSPSKPSDIWLNIGEIDLYPTDKNILLSPNEWLNDSIINASQILLKSQTIRPLKGFEDTQRSKKVAFTQSSGKFVQIIHVSSSHWIAVSNCNCTQINEVIIYDSLFSGLSNKTKKQICFLIEFPSNIHSVRFMVSNMQQQSDSSIIVWLICRCCGY